MPFIVIAIAGRLFNFDSPALDLSVRPRLVNFRQLMFDFMLIAEFVLKCFLDDLCCAFYAVITL